MIYVTHDQIEAMTLADRIAIMRGGSIQQLDSPRMIYNKPRNKYVAGFIGSPPMNFLEGRISGGKKPVFVFGKQRIGLGGYEFSAGSPGEGPAIFGIRPEHVAVGAAAKGQPFRASAVVEVVEPMGADTLVWSRLEDSELRFRVGGQSAFRPGDKVTIGFEPAQASLFDAKTEARI
jgi:multiple sugar transport system ATP-binding protein